MSSSRIILASSSPRRRQLLAEASYDFEVIPPSDTAETGHEAGESPTELVSRLAWQKAKDVAERIDRGIIIGCDTVAWCEGRILGKPADRDHALEILTWLRGREHYVVSGVCVWQRPENTHRTEVATTRLIMDPISDQQLAAYLATNAWRGKAGAFGYQDGLDWVRVLEGSETNVVGLSMELLAEMLRDVGWDQRA